MNTLTENELALIYAALLEAVETYRDMDNSCAEQLEALAQKIESATRATLHQE